MTTVVVEVMLKPQIHDPQGEAIAAACRRLGLAEVVGVRQGKRFELELVNESPDALGRISRLAGDLLANPVIEDLAIRPGLAEQRYKPVTSRTSQVRDYFAPGGEAFRM